MLPNDETEERIARAIQLCSQGIPVRQAAYRYDLIPSTLLRRLNHTKLHRKAAKPLQKLHPEQENMIVNWILYEEICGRTPSRRFTTGVAEAIFEA
ncbi:hypothetical protein F4779DRAFT_569908 [Xylariaceae sp. FL0662B]|nr:hypothetical protein F4779DRAFT_569908 [Xylariaceae sp. FL0662B]